MTTGQKWMSLFLLQAGLLGGAYAAGRYPEWKKGQAAAESAHNDYEKLRTDARQAVLTTQARAVLMEAALAVRYGNYGMAFERVIRAQTAAQNLKMTALQKDFDELSALLIAQKPEVLEKILIIADKIEPPAKLVPNELSGPSKPAAMLVPPAGAAPATPALPAAPASAPTADVPTHNPGSAKPAPATTTLASAPSPAAPSAAAPAALPRNASPDATIEQSRAALLGAKELLITGSEPVAIIAKIAHAQVILEEGGHAEFAEQFSTAIKALRAHEETKARTALDAVLTSLRGL